MDKIGENEVVNILKKMVDNDNEDFIDIIKKIIKKKIRIIFTTKEEHFIFV